MCVKNNNYHDNNDDDDDHNNHDNNYNNDNIQIIHKNIDINMYGKPLEYEKNNFIVWDFVKPHPWTKIIYKYNEKYPFYFFIKVKIPSLNDYNNWKNIISNIDFDPKLGEIIIPAEDDETALSIINLMLTNFKGDISIEEIIKKDLINVSINKAKKYEIVKNKLIEQIMYYSENKDKKEHFNDVSYETDLAHKNNISQAESAQENNNDYIGYEGIEYSFFT